jgi:hypothetical protein
MKISIGINGYKEHKDLEKREKFCIESLLKNKKENVNLYNVCFTDENIKYDSFETLNQLCLYSNSIIKNYFSHEGLHKEYEQRKSDIDNNNKKLPSVKEIFDVLSHTDCDYFLFLNNDIILSNRFLKNIDSSVDCYAVSRMHIHDIESLNEEPKLESYSVHGFDAFLIKKETWLKIRNNFPDLILGRFYWDTYFVTKFKLLCNTKFVNDLPPVCFHIEHNSKSSENTIENYYNEDVFKRDLIIGHLWFSYVQNVPLKRPTINNCKWYQPFPNEKEIEEKHFNQLNQKTLFDPNFEKLPITNKNDFDLFIPVAPKDEIKLSFVIEYANKHLKHNKIFVCSPHNITNKITDSKISYINDNDVLNIPDKSFISFRPNWTYQQFLKLFFNFSESQYYFALDADTIIIKDLPLFENEHPIWYYGWQQNHFPYFLFNKKFFNLDKSLKHTGIGDLGLFNKNITQTFLNYTGCKSPKELLLKTGPQMNVVFHFSEYETYANFTNTHYTGLYKFKHLEQENMGRDLNQGESWSKEDIKQVIENYKSSSKSILSLHSWKI